MQGTEHGVVRWTFILHPDGRWTWILAAGGGMPDQVSETGSSLGAVMADAVRHGFNPERHLWTVANKDWPPAPTKPPMSAVERRSGQGQLSGGKTSKHTR